MARAKRSNMVTDTIQIIPERPNLGSWIIHVLVAPLLAMGYITGEIQSLYGEDDVVLGLVVEYPVLSRESLELNNDDWR